MTTESLVRAGGVTFILDTNVALRTRRLQGLCNRVARLNVEPFSLDLRVCAPSVVHMEICHDLRQSIRTGGRSFDPEIVDKVLRINYIEVLPFDREQAERAAQWLDSCFQSADSWREAKRRQCVGQLGLRQEDAPGKRCSATVDWLIASYACLARHVVVTEDRGREFCGVERKMGLEALELLLDALLQGAPE